MGDECKKKATLVASRTHLSDNDAQLAHSHNGTKGFALLVAFFGLALFL